MWKVSSRAKLIFINRFGYSSFCSSSSPFVLTTHINIPMAARVFAQIFVAGSAKLLVRVLLFGSHGYESLPV